MDIQIFSNVIDPIEFASEIELFWTDEDGDRDEHH